MKKWSLLLLTIVPGIILAQISNDGNYVMNRFDSVLAIRSTCSSWKMELVNISGEKFTYDGKRLNYMRGDSLCSLLLGSTQKPVCRTGIEYFIQPEAGGGEIVACKPKGDKNSLLLIDILTGKEKKYSDVTEFTFSKSGAKLIIKNLSHDDSTFELKLIDPATYNEVVIWKDGKQKMASYILDNSENQMALLIEDNDISAKQYSIWYYKDGMTKAELLINTTSRGIGSDVEIDGRPVLTFNLVYFSPNGQKLFFTLKDKPLNRENKNEHSVDVWSYTDAKLQSQQKKDSLPRAYTSVMDIATRRVIQIEHENEIIPGNTPLGGVAQLNDSLAITFRFKGNIINYGNWVGRFTDMYSMNEYNWNKATICDVYLVSLYSGSRKLLKADLKAASSNFPFFSFSPSGKYVISFDGTNGTYTSYEIATGLSHIFFKGKPEEWVNGEVTSPSRQYYVPMGPLAWLPNDAGVFVQDHFTDLWLMDPLGKRLPENITNGFAKRNKKTFYMESDDNSYYLGDKIISDSTRIIVMEEEGAYYQVIKGKDPVIMANGMHIDAITRAKFRSMDFIVIKTPNFYWRVIGSYKTYFYFSSDLKNLTPLFTNYVSEYKSPYEVKGIRWKSFDGTTCAGVLAKPVNFDASKKYPVICSYYEKWGEPDEKYLDSGYVVFTPWIDYKTGKTKESVYNSIVSGAMYISKMPFVDASKIGITGYSFGGYETNLLVTSTHIFAAAFSGAGMTDLFSHYGAEEKDGQGYSYMGADETGQIRIGATPWERPDLYLKNSPVFYADRVTTPILLTQNKEDVRVPYSQNIELFTALRRLGKKVWLLSGDGGHGGYDDQIGLMSMQFFNHYLKGAPAPVWMTRGVPARLRGITTGMEYDSTMKTPGPGLLMDEEMTTPDQKELLKHKTTVNDQGRIVDVPEKPKTKK